MSSIRQITKLVQLMGYILLQIVVAKHIFVPYTAFCFVYIGFLLSMPYRQTQTIFSLQVGFGVGMLVDLFYDSLGMHAFACVLLMYTRPLLLQYLLPTSHQELDFKPTWGNMGARSFTVYALALILLHHSALFSWDAADTTLLRISIQKTLCSTLLTYTAVMLVQGMAVLTSNK